MKSLSKQIVALLLGLSMFLVPTVAFAEEGRTEDTLSISRENAEFSDAEVEELEQHLEVLFSQVVIPDGEGKLKIDYDAARKLYPEKNLSDLSMPATRLDRPTHGTGALGLQEYARCVVKGAIPFIGLLDVNWGLIRHWVSKKNWGALSRYLGKEIPKRAAKFGIKDAFRFTPWGIAASLAASAVTCAVWRSW